MKYPKFWRKTNKVLSVISGGLALVIAVLSAFEAIARYFFGSPTSWTLNVCCYILVWCIFLGSSYAFQEHGHVGVDLIRDMVDKRSKKRLPRRIMSVIGYVITFIFLAVLLYGVVGLAQKAVEFNMLTTSAAPIHMMWLYLGMLVGTVMMLITVVFIILDLFTKSEDYL